MARSESRESRQGERGFALLFALVAVVLLTLIGLTLTFSSINQYSVSVEFESHERALMIADAGLNEVRQGLRLKDFDATLSTSTNVPRYLADSDPAVGTLPARNPIPPIEARNVNFSYPPNSIGTRVVRGMLTPASGTLMGTGRYFASVTDNDDEAVLGLTNNLLDDRDDVIIVRVMGVQPSMTAELQGQGSARKNAVAILEAILKRDKALFPTSPFTVYGPDADATFQGNSFDFVGDEDHPGIAVLNNDPENGDATQLYKTIRTEIGNMGRLSGALGPDGISLMDQTQAYRDDPDPDKTQVFDPDFWVSFLNSVGAIADNFYTEDIVLGGTNVQLGTVDAPQITVALGDLKLSMQGAGSGAGVLVVGGDFEIGGSFVFDGLVFVVGDGRLWFHGANKVIRGGLFLAKLEEHSGELEFGMPRLTISGNSDFTYNEWTINNALSSLPLRTLSVREVTPEVEPTVTVVEPLN